MSERELKFTFPNHAKNSLLNSLSSSCIKDGEYELNTVHSLYFDTHDFLFAMEKASSDYNKSKVRIRWYTSENSTEASQCHLEFKNKIGSTRRKIRIEIAKNPEELFIGLKSGTILDIIQKHIAQNCPELLALKLRPVFSISYNRHRFLEQFSDSRIACDTNILARPFNLDKSFIVGQARLDAVLLEVKGHEQELPKALRKLAHKGLKKAAFSKYYECFCLLTDYQQ